MLNGEFILDALPDMVVVLDTRQTIRFLNRAAEQAGFFCGDAYLETVQKQFAPDDADVQAIRRGIVAVTSGILPRFTLEYRTGLHDAQDQSAQVCWFSLDVVPYLQDRIRGVIIQQSEQTRKIEQRNIRESLAQHADMVQRMVDTVEEYAIFLLDTEGAIVSWNRGAERIKGYTASEIIGKHFFCFYSEQEQRDDKPSCILQEAAILGRFEENGWRFRKDGSKFWANVLITSLRDDRGLLCGYAKIVRDITERKFIDEQIRSSVDRAKMLIEIAQAFDEVNLNYHALLNTISRLVAMLIGDACFIRLVSPDGQWLELVSSFHPDPDLARFFQEFIQVNPQRTDEGATAEVIRTGRPLIIPHLTTEKIQTMIKPEYRAMVEKFRVFSMIILPLRAQGKVIGVISVIRNTGEPYTLDDQIFLQDVCDRAALSITNARLFDEVQRELAERKQAEEALAWEAASNAAIAELARALISPISLDELSFQVLEHARKLTGSVYGFVGYIDPKTGFLISSTLTRDIWGGCQVPNKSFVFREFKGLWGWVLNHCESMMTNRMDLEPRSTGIPVGHLPISRYLGVPAMIGSTLVGQISLANSDRDYTARDLQLIENMASFYAISIQRKRSEEALHESQQLLQSVVSSAPIILLAVDSQGIITLAEGKGLLDLGGKPGQDIGSHYTAGYRQHPNIIEYIRRGLAGEEVSGTIDIPFLDSEQKKTFDVRVLPIWNDEGQVVRVISVGADITERRHSEIIQQRAREVAELATQAKSEFLANMSHEIRTPLNAIIGMTNLLLDTQLNDEQREFVGTIRISGSSLLSIVNDILDFSKIEAGKLDLENQPFDLRECVEDALNLLAPNASEKQLNMAYFMEESTPAVFIGDVTRIRQILVNLLSNAVKFTEHGEIVVSVESRPTRDLAIPIEIEEDSPRYTIHIAVRDTGPGIPPDRFDRLFRSFSQVDTSTARRFGGTGLGLAISKRLAEMMGGTMWVESEEGLGSTFHFTLQVEAASELTDDFLLPAPHTPLFDKEVLIIGDSSSNRFVLAYHIASWGMVPHITTNSDEALEWIRTGVPFDAAILDMIGPDEDSQTLAMQIQSYRSPEQLPIIVYTQVGAARYNRHSSLKIAALLNKPIRPSHLYDVLLLLFEHPVPGEKTKKAVQTVEPEIKPDNGEQGEREKDRSDWSRRAAMLHQQRQKVESTSAFPTTLNSKMGNEHPLSILLAEDNVVNQKVALRLLEKIGYRADVAANGQEVLDVLGWRSYDVILMDVQMPEMDGLSATRYIRMHWPPDQQPHIIAMTAHALAGDRQRCLNAGMNDYISKPVQIEYIAAALQRAQKRTPKKEVLRKEELLETSEEG